jgi:Tol biopolymer transport system component
LEAVQTQLARIQAMQTAVPSPTAASAGGAIVTIPISVQDMSSAEIATAELWNRMGTTITEIADTYNLDLLMVVGVIQAGGGGAGFGADGRLLIRFETHIFYDMWGKSYPDVFNRYFQFNPNERWRDHQWRPNVDAEWQLVHEGQQMEWQVFDFARALNETAALQSISMGTPQTMGFNAAAMGYVSPQAMFADFQQGEAEQILALFRLFESRQLIDPLRRGDLFAFATGYFGAGQAEFYESLIRRYIQVFADLYQRSVGREAAVQITTLTPTPTPTVPLTATATATSTATPTPVPVTWPPTGEIVFASNRTNRIGDLFAIRPSSGSSRRLTENMGFEPSYSPANGGRIAFAAQPDQRVSIYTMAPDGSQESSLTGFDTDNWEPALSPDGQHIAFVSSRNNLDWEIYVMRADGTEVTQLTNSDPARNTMPAWSPDGNRIVFVRFENAETSHIYTMNRDGTDPRQLTTVAAKNEYPDWSPDGSKILFASNRTGAMDLFVMNTDGSNLRNLTQSPEEENFPSWSPDGKWIAFARFVGNTDIFVMTADGQSVTNVTQSPEDEWAPVWLP